MNEDILIEYVEERDKVVKWIINIVMLLGSTGFLAVGISSYINRNLIPFLESSEIIFFPQGITMTFYGILGFLFSINQILILIWNIGEGYNEFNKKDNRLLIYRHGFPWKNKDILIEYKLSEVEAIKLETKTEAFNTRQNIYACIKGKRDIPIVQVSSPLKIQEIEEKATRIASFINVSIKSF